MATREYGFTLWGKRYRTDMKTLRVLGTVMERAMTSGDCSAVIAMISLGTVTGRIVEVVAEGESM